MGRSTTWLRILFLGLILAARISADVEIEGADDSEEEVEADGPDDVDTDEIRVEESVLVLSGRNFDDALEQHETILVEFYAPWCGHCKSLAPEYAAAAAVLADADPPVALAKVDATVHNELASRFSVQGYPTLIFFKNGMKNDYDGPRTKDGIVKYMKEKASPDWKPEPEAVVTLTWEDFEEVIQNEDVMMVEFYAPWCGHCKRLAPIYEKAAKQLKKNDPPIMLAKVDATQETELARKFNVNGYPTIKIFKKGKAFEYKGGRDSEYDFISTIMNYVGDGAKEISDLKKLKRVFPVDDIMVIGFFNNADDELAKPYKDFADEFREDYKLGITYDNAARKAYKINSGSVVVFNAERFYTKFEPKWHVLQVEDDTTTEDVKDFVEKHKVPLVGHYAGDQIPRYDSSKPLCIFLYSVDFSFDHREATQLWRNKIAAVAKKYTSITFAIANDDDNADMLAGFGLADSGEDINVGIISEDGKKFGMEPMEDFDTDEIKEFLDSFLRGKLKPVIKSQRVPKKQSGPVTVVVGDSFEKIVMDPKKDVLIELYAPWCGHCKKLEPIYETLAKKLKKDKKLVIAKMDATANDAPESYSTTGFPTIFYAPANSKDKPIMFEGERDVEGFESFLKEKAVVSFGKGGKDEL